MAKSEKKRQQKRAKHKAKRQEKKQALVREQTKSIAERIQDASRMPILHSWISDGTWDQGMGQVMFSRELPSGSVAVATFLVDRYCLGVKDAMAAIVAKSQYTDRFVRRAKREMPHTEVSPEKARKFVESAVEYASSIGFQPHSDYHKAKLIFGDVAASDCDEEFEFGKDGKPLFINGPNDSLARCRAIVNTLSKTVGSGGYDYLLMGDAQDLGLDTMPVAPQLSDESEDDEPEQLEDHSEEERTESLEGS